MRALITGGAGFIGSHLAEALLEKGWQVEIIDNLSTGRFENIAHLERHPSFSYVIDTIMDETSCPRDFECYRSRFEKLCPVRKLVGTNLIECQSGRGQECLMSTVYGQQKLVCGCQLRSFAAVELEI